MRHLRYTVTAFSVSHIVKMRRAFESIMQVNMRGLVEEDMNIFLHKIRDKFLPEGITKFAPIFIDIFVPLNSADFEKYEAPFANLDFECNGLIYNKHGIHISRAVYDTNFYENNLNTQPYRLAVQCPLNYFQKLSKIIENIENRLAVIVNKDIHINRLRKMLHKGWKISGLNFVFIDRVYLNYEREFTTNEIVGYSEEHDDVYEDTCIICHETFLIY